MSDTKRGLKIAVKSDKSQGKSSGERDLIGFGCPHP